MKIGAWHAIACGVGKRGTQLSNQACITHTYRSRSTLLIGAQVLVLRSLAFFFFNVDFFFFNFVGFIEFVTLLLLFCFGFWPTGRGILAP